MRYFLFILGCQMNIADAERVSAVLNSLGFKKTDNENEADLMVVLACSVRQSAMDRVYGKIHKWNKNKKAKKLTTVLTGCVMPTDKKKLKEKFDLILHIEDLNKLPRLLRPRLPLPSSSFSFPKDYLCLASNPFSSSTAYIPIMTGCNNYCSYCVVPYTRGPERSRTEKEIIKEVKRLVKNGAMEIVLVGQNVNSYGHKKGVQYKDNKPFISLLRSLNKIPGKFWIHFISNHPKDMTEDLIKEMPKLKKVAPWIHLPLQSGDDEIIKKMNRHYTAKQYIKLVELIRKNIPNVAITTDIIVGFPGETKKQFQNTLDLAKKARYDMAYLSEYSERPGTAAARLKDNLSKKEKKRRKEVLTKVIEKSAYKNNKKLHNTTQEILVDGQKKDYYYGRTETWKVVKFKSTENVLGKLLKVKITKIEPWKIFGKK